MFSDSFLARALCTSLGFLLIQSLKFVGCLKERLHTGSKKYAHICGGSARLELGDCMHSVSKHPWEVDCPFAHSSYPDTLSCDREKLIQ